MSRSGTEPLGALREALRESAAEGFAQVMEEGLGARLRRATEALLERGVEEEVEKQLRHFFSGLDRFEDRGRVDRSRVVAHGMRICMALAAQEVGERAPVAKKPSLGRRRGGGPSSSKIGKPAEAGAAEKQSSTRSARATKKASAFASELTALPGVGAKTAEKLAQRGLESLEDLAYLLPLAYEDRRTMRRISEVREGETVVVEGRVASFKQGWFRGRYMASMGVEQEEEDGRRERLEARWFHPVGGLGQRVTTGETIVLAGTIKLYREHWSMVHPEILDPSVDGAGIAVRYPVVEGVGQRTVRKLCLEALKRLKERGLRDALPREFVEAQRLPDPWEALQSLHEPPEDISEEDLLALQERRSDAHRRLAFDEFFFLQLALLRQRGEWIASPSTFALAEGAFDAERLRACLPFEPTGAQWRVLRELEADLVAGPPMLRLLQGDVGSGKTVVAFASALALIESGGQAAMMAPTEILAEQHYRTLKGWSEKAGIRIALLTGSTPKGQRRSTLALLEAGSIDLLVGTHALLVEDVNFRRLALVIVDEQHRFGVEQRSVLRDKGDAPHLLVMTATPIPRSLALTAFGELEVSIIDEMPPGREASKTKLFAGKRALGSARKKLCDRVRKGERSFVVCPLVEASEAVAASDVEEASAALAEMLPEHRVGVVHGRMLSRDKDAIMSDFRSGKLDVLVATTVIEVGVDIPDAKVILIEHAERFGLAQLHQLRGRVGRAGGGSHCFLHTSSPRKSEVGERLGILEETSDGFRLAERDLELRGPGEVFGTRQSGVPRLRFASFSEDGMKMLIAAREAAKGIIDEDPRLENHPSLSRELGLRIGGPLYAGESG